MKRVITSFSRANKDLLNYIIDEFPDGIEEETLVNFPKAGGGFIRALEIEMGDTLYLVRLEDEAYYQKYMAKEEEDEEDPENVAVELDDEIEEVEVDEELEIEDEEDEDEDVSKLDADEDEDED